MFEDKVVLVTGGSRGIGRSVAVAFGEKKATVAVNYASSEAAAQEVVELIKKAGGKAKAYKADVADEAQVADMFKAIESDFGTVDVLVNNAGITKDTLMMRMKAEDFDAVIDTNLKSAFLCTKAAMKGMMKKRYGKIINMSSVVGAMGNAGQANYVASKAGLIGLTKTSALELAGRGIRVNAVAPGFIETDMTGELSEDIRGQLLKMIPLNSFGKPEDIASATIFLASPESDYMTGQTIHINGGMYM